MTQTNQFCQFPEKINPESALERILECDNLPMEAVLLALAGLKFINDEFDERMTVLAAEHAEQAAFESGYGM